MGQVSPECYRKDAAFDRGTMRADSFVSARWVHEHHWPPSSGSQPRCKPDFICSGALRHSLPAWLSWWTAIAASDGIVATDYLEQCGCCVLRAENAEKALEALNGQERINLVLSDIAMPGMSGLELARLVRDHHPEIGIVLATGYSDKASRAVDEGFRLIEKPYSLDVMRQSLTAAVDAQNTEGCLPTGEIIPGKSSPSAAPSSPPQSGA
jgi:CheY-like chemotaxis protein